MDRNSKNKICAAVICGAFLLGALGGLGISPREAERMTERNVPFAITSMGLLVSILPAV